jgi:signal recognition particle GTPase
MSKLDNIAEALVKSEMREAIHSQVVEQVKRVLERDETKKVLGQLVEAALQQALHELTKESKAYASDVPPVTPVSVGR